MARAWPCRQSIAANHGGANRQNSRTETQVIADIAAVGFVRRVPLSEPLQAERRQVLQDAVLEAMTSH